MSIIASSLSPSFDKKRKIAAAIIKISSFPKFCKLKLLKLKIVQVILLKLIVLY